MTIRTLSGLAAGILAFAASAASATIVQGSGLQNGLDNRSFADGVGTDADFYDVNAAQLGNDELWSMTAPGITGNRLIFEFAGYKNINSFGIYDVNDPDNQLQIFAGNDGAGAFEVVVDLGNTFMSLVDGYSTTFSSSVFGYYLHSPDGIFYSQAALNPGGADQMVAFQGQGDLYFDAMGYGVAAPFTSGAYILAWEDLAIWNSDRDFSDFVVMVDSVTPVPAPAGLALLGLGLLGLGLGRRRA